MATADPFASAPAADEAQTTTPEPEAPQESPFDNPPADAPEAPKEAPITDKPAPRPVPTGDGKVVLTFKGGSGYDAPWIVIHAADLDDAAAQIEGENANTLAKIMEKVQRAGQHFSGLAPAKASTGGGGNSGGSGRQAPPQGAQEAPGGEKRYCSHGEMQFKSGTSKQGKPWKGFFCPTPKGTSDQCDAQFLRG